MAKIVAANAGGKLSLGDALSLLFLMAAKQDERRCAGGTGSCPRGCKWRS